MEEGHPRPVQSHPRALVSMRRPRELSVGKCNRCSFNSIKIRRSNTTQFSSMSKITFSRKLSGKSPSCSRLLLTSCLASLWRTVYLRAKRVEVEIRPLVHRSSLTNRCTTNKRFSPIPLLTLLFSKVLVLNSSSTCLRTSRCRAIALMRQDRQQAQLIRNPSPKRKNRRNRQ